MRMENTKGKNHSKYFFLCLSRLTIKINQTKDNYSFGINCFSIKRSFVFKTSNTKLRFFKSVSTCFYQ